MEESMFSKEVVMNCVRPVGSFSVARISDVHVNAFAKVGGRERFDSEGRNVRMERTLDALEWAIRTAVDERGCTWIVIDELFDHHNPRPADYLAISALFRDLFDDDETRKDRRRQWLLWRGNVSCVTFIAGNHALPYRGAGPLDVLVEMMRRAPGAPPMSVVSRPRLAEYHGVNFVMLPYLRIGAEGADMDGIRGMVPTGDSGFRSRVLFFHGTTVASNVSPGHDEIPLPTDLLKLFDVALGGHVHKASDHYVGSLVAQNHGEANDFHGFATLTFDGDGAIIVDKVATPAEFNLRFATINLSAMESFGATLNRINEHVADRVEFVRLRYAKEDEASIPLGKIKQHLQVNGALSVDLAPIVPERGPRGRSLTISGATGPLDALRETLAVKGEEEPGWMADTFREVIKIAEGEARSGKGAGEEEEEEDVK